MTTERLRWKGTLVPIYLFVPLWELLLFFRCLRSSASLWAMSCHRLSNQQAGGGVFFLNNLFNRYLRVAGALTTDRMLLCSSHNCVKTLAGKNHHSMLWDPRDALATQEYRDMPWDPQDAAGYKDAVRWAESQESCAIPKLLPDEWDPGVRWEPGGAVGCQRRCGTPRGGCWRGRAGRSRPERVPQALPAARPAAPTTPTAPPAGAPEAGGRAGARPEHDSLGCRPAHLQVRCSAPRRGSGGFECLIAAGAGTGVSEGVGSHSLWNVLNAGEKALEGQEPPCSEDQGFTVTFSSCSH